MYPAQIQFESLVQALNAKGRVPYLQADATTTTVGLAAMGAYGRSILVEESFLSQGMSELGVVTRATAVLARLNALTERIIASQLDHANTYRGRA